MSNCQDVELCGSSGTRAPHYRQHCISLLKFSLTFNSQTATDDSVLQCGTFSLPPIVSLNRNVLKKGFEIRKKKKMPSHCLKWQSTRERTVHKKSQSLTPYLSLRSVNRLHKIFASCVKAASEDSVYKAAAVVYVGHHVTSRNTVWPEYIDFSQQSKDGPFFVFKQISIGFLRWGG